jgi:hypothetical protein
MTYTPLEQKLREDLLTFTEVTAYVGTNIFNDQLPQGLLSQPAPFRALTIKRISTQRLYNLDALSINKALIDFLNQFCATETALFSSPPTTPTQFPNIILNEMIVPYSPTQPPLYSGIVDARIYNREDL